MSRQPELNDLPELELFERITVERMRRAYSDAGVFPLFGEYIYRDQDPFGKVDQYFVCAIVALLMAEGFDAGTLCYEDAIELAIDVFGWSKHYICGFINRFDGNPRKAISDMEYNMGQDDGENCRRWF